MAEIAAIFHWPLRELEALSLEELVMWRNAAVKVWRRMNVSPKS